MKIKIMKLTTLVRQASGAFTGLCKCLILLGLLVAREGIEPPTP